LQLLGEHRYLISLASQLANSISFADSAQCCGSNRFIGFYQQGEAAWRGSLSISHLVFINLREADGYDSTDANQFHAAFAFCRYTRADEPF